MAGGSELPQPAQCRTQQITVEYDYPVVFTRDLFAADNDDLLWCFARREPERRHKVYVIVDQGVAEAWPRLTAEIERWFDHRSERVTLLARPLVIVGGEAAKNDGDFVSALLARFRDVKLDRQSFVLIVGGGAVLDAAGYAAAITHRGVRVVRAPTTVLSQNDAGIGVKNGVNAFATKNFLGTFAPPFAVINDIDFIRTLGARDRRAGIAEAVKVACIRDAPFFDWLEENRAGLKDSEPAVMQEMIRHCADLHLQHISGCGDPFEMGSARPLDFGHWAAHRLEAMSRHALRHGEAVAIGIALDTRISVLTGRLQASEQERIWGTLADVGFQLWHPALAEAGPDGRLAVLRGLDEFREHLGGELTVTLLDAIGRGVEVHEIDEAAVGEAIVDLKRAMGA
ncbi:MAG: 3-dehydroquinate synthase [Myxococcota bacterium]